MNVFRANTPPDKTSEQARRGVTPGKEERAIHLPEEECNEGQSMLVDYRTPASSSRTLAGARLAF